MQANFLEAGENGLSFIVTHGPAIRSYDDLPMLRAKIYAPKLNRHHTTTIGSSLKRTEP